LFYALGYPSYICNNSINPILATLSHTGKSSTSEISEREVIYPSSDTIEAEIDSNKPMIIMDMRETERHGKILAKNIVPIVQKYRRKSTICKNKENMTYCIYL
jgi:hypothetical protein